MDFLPGSAPSTEVTGGSPALGVARLPCNLRAMVCASSTVAGSTSEVASELVTLVMSLLNGLKVASLALTASLYGIMSLSTWPMEAAAFVWSASKAGILIMALVGLYLGPKPLQMVMRVLKLATFMAWPVSDVDAMGLL